MKVMNYLEKIKSNTALTSSQFDQITKILIYHKTLKLKLMEYNSTKGLESKIPELEKNEKELNQFLTLYYMNSEFQTKQNLMEAKMVADIYLLRENVKSILEDEIPHSLKNSVEDLDLLLKGNFSVYNTGIEDKTDALENLKEGINHFMQIQKRTKSFIPKIKNETFKKLIGDFEKATQAWNQTLLFSQKKEAETQKSTSENIPKLEKPTNIREAMMAANDPQIPNLETSNNIPKSESVPKEEKKASSSKKLSKDLDNLLNDDMLNPTENSETASKSDTTSEKSERKESIEKNQGKEETAENESPAEIKENLLSIMDFLKEIHPGNLSGEKTDGIMKAFSYVLQVSKLDKLIKKEMMAMKPQEKRTPVQVPHQEETPIEQNVINENQSYLRKNQRIPKEPRFEETFSPKIQNQQNEGLNEMTIPQEVPRVQSQASPFTQSQYRPIKDSYDAMLRKMMNN